MILKVENVPVVGIAFMQTVKRWNAILIQKIVKKLADYKAYKEYENGFKYLKSIHAARYRLYFTGSKEDVEAYSAEIERYGNAMLNVGEDYVSNNILNEKHTKRVKEILDQISEFL